MDALLNLSRCRGSLLALTVFNDVFLGLVILTLKLSSGDIKEALRLGPRTCTAADCPPTLKYLIGHIGLQ